MLRARNILALAAVSAVCAALPASAPAAPAPVRALVHAVHAKQVLGVPRSRLDTIARCESHDNPRSIGGGGLYRGKYQFDRGTWASVGGRGDPAAAGSLEQDIRAAMLLNRSGASPWPVCGA